MGLRVGKGDPLSSRGGSFGAPKDDEFLREAMADRRKKEEPMEEEAPELEALPVVTKPPQSELELALFKEATDIGLEITDDDLMTFIFRSFITKEVPVINGKLHAMFRSTTGEDLSLINKRVSQAIAANPGMMQKELQNLNTINIFAQTLLRLGPPNAMRELPESFEDKAQQLNAMSPLILNKLSMRYNLLEFLLEKKLNDEDSIKN